MSSTLNKSIKTAVALLLCLCALVLCTACNKTPKNLDEADQICVSGSYAESWMYVFTDETFVAEMAGIFSDIKVKESEEPVDMMTVGEIVSLTFSNGNNSLGTIIVDKNNNLCYEAGTQSYKITSEFDFDYVKKLIDEQIEAINESYSSTPDEF